MRLLNFFLETNSDSVKLNNALMDKVGSGTGQVFKAKYCLLNMVPDVQYRIGMAGAIKAAESDITLEHHNV